MAGIEKIVATEQTASAERFYIVVSSHAMKEISKPAETPEGYAGFKNPIMTSVHYKEDGLIIADVRIPEGKEQFKFPKNFTLYAWKADE